MRWEGRGLFVPSSPTCYVCLSFVDRALGNEEGMVGGSLVVSTFYKAVIKI